MSAYPNRPHRETCGTPWICTFLLGAMILAAVGFTGAAAAALTSPTYNFDHVGWFAACTMVTYGIIAVFIWHRRHPMA